MKTISHNFAENQHYIEMMTKKGIVFQTMSGNQAPPNRNCCQSTPHDRTVPIVSIQQLFSSRYWAHHRAFR